MTYDEIKNYQSRASAIQSMSDEIEWLYGKITCPNGRESIGGGMPSTPGDPTAQNVARIETLKHKRSSLEGRQRACERYVDELEDYRLASILRYRFILGWTWESTAARIIGTRSYNGLIKEVKKHFGVYTDEYKTTQKI